MENILTRGLKPYANWDSEDLPVVSLTDSPEQALLEAYAVDMTKVQLGEKERPVESYIALRINAGRYTVMQWQVDEWWVTEPVRPENITVIGEEDFGTIEKRFDEKYPKIT